MDQACGRPVDAASRRRPERRVGEFSIGPAPSRSREQRSIQRRERFGEGRQRQRERSAARGFGHRARTDRAARRRVAHRGDQRSAIVSVDDPAVDAFVDQLGGAARIARDHRQPDGPRLERGVRERIVERRQRRRRRPSRGTAARRRRADEADTRRRCRAPGPDTGPRACRRRRRRASRRARRASAAIAAATPLRSKPDPTSTKTGTDASMPSARRIGPRCTARASGWKRATSTPLRIRTSFAGSIAKRAAISSRTIVELQITVAQRGMLEHRALGRARR